MRFIQKFAFSVFLVFGSVSQAELGGLSHPLIQVITEQ